jgi:hypothetical protein
MVEERAMEMGTLPPEAAEHLKEATFFTRRICMHHPLYRVE